MLFNFITLLNSYGNPRYIDVAAFASTVEPIHLASLIASTLGSSNLKSGNFVISTPGPPPSVWKTQQIYKPLFTHFSMQSHSLWLHDPILLSSLFRFVVLGQRKSHSCRNENNYISFVVISCKLLPCRELTLISTCIRAICLRTVVGLGRWLFALLGQRCRNCDALRTKRYEYQTKWFG